MTKTICMHCNRPAVLEDGKNLYPHNAMNWGNRYWHCKPCKAWVKCKAGTDIALGRPGNTLTRSLRMEAHWYLDALIKRKVEAGASEKDAKRAAYAWMAKELKLSEEEAHIGLFGVEECQKVIRLCDRFVQRKFSDA